MVIEISFPRGGRKPITKSNHKFKKDYDLFGSKRKQKHNRKQQVTKPVNDADKTSTDEIEASSAELINYRSLQDGMVLLGCIRDVQKMALGINLPGRLTGRVMITQISNPYTQLLHSIVDDNEPEGFKSLRQIFTNGECVAVKVVDVNGSDEKFRIGLSMMPHDVNAQLHHTQITTGMILWGAVSGIEDHGYVIDLGVNNCRAFLQKTNIDQEKTYTLGEVSWFVVQKSESSSVATTLSLNATSNKLDNMKIIKEISIDHLLPGMKLEFTICKRLTNGLEGKFLNDYIGYIHESHLSEPLNNYSIGQTITPRVMYTVPITKFVYFTLRDLKTCEKGTIPDGTLTNCMVTSVSKTGLYVQFTKNKSEKGFVSFRRLKTKLSIDSEIDDYTLVKQNYPIKSKHKCRVLSYEYLEQVYICSLEKELTENIVFSVRDLKIGQEVSAVIKEIQPNGLLAQVDNTNCYIKNIHLSDIVLNNYANIKNKFKAGQTVKTKVWSISEDEKSCYLTMKPSLLNTEKIFTSYNEIEVNKQYLGIVKKIYTNGVLVEFFGNTFGWIRKNYLSAQKFNKPEEMFKIGQLVKCTVLNFNVESKRLTLSLQPPKLILENKLLKLGQHVDGVVTNIISEGIEVNIKHFNIPGMIPLLHITKFPSIAHILAGTYKKGDLLTNLVCVNHGHRMPILSIRDRHLNEDNVVNFEDLELNTRIPCSIQSMNNTGMLLQAPIENYTRLIRVMPDNITKIGPVDALDIKLNQLVVAKILDIVKDKKDSNKQNILASVKLDDCWDYNLNESVDNLREYMAEIETVKNHYVALNKPLGSLSLGEIVTGVVQEQTPTGSYIVDLSNGVRAVAYPEHIKEKISVGSEVKGVVLWLDVINDIAEISLCPKLLTRINQVQDGEIDIPNEFDSDDVLNYNAHAEVLLVKENFAVVVLRGHNCNRQVAFLPTKLHPNDFFPDYSPYSIGTVIKIVIKKLENGKIFGIAKQLIHIIKKKQEIENRSGKRKRNSESESENYTLKAKKKKSKESKKQKLSENVITDTKQKDNNDDNDDVDVDTEIQVEKVKKHKRTNSTSSESEKITVDEEEKSSKKNKKQKIIENDSSENSDTKKSKKDKKNSDKESSIVEQTKISKKQKTDEINVQNTKDHIKVKEIKRKEVNENKSKKKQQTDKVNEDELVLPGANDFWNLPGEENVEEESSGDEDHEQEALKKLQKKKKMTPAERAEAARLEEERIRKIEIELADAENAPKTADQFDRLLLAKPNDSLLWINYMAFHLESVEIEKARAVARKALNTIEFREEQEKLNVWIAFLNLENRYGTKESFNAVLDEAVKMNDSLQVYIQALNILADSKKTSDLIELMTRVTKKFKSEFKMWTSVAAACYKCELIEQARNLMQRALTSLPNKQHINVIVQFAFMEAKANEVERAETLFEQILASYPRRVDVWTSFVDMLVKNNRIHVARNVLSKAICQKLPARKMKTIFTKFLQFEQTHGDEENINKVRELAVNYVKKSTE